jgi:hypothetical protein
VSGNFTVTVRATDTSGCFGDKVLNLSISCPATVLSPSVALLSSATQAQAYSQTFSVSGATAPYTWSILSGTVPSGLTMNGSTGVLSGLPTGAAGSYTFTVKVVDAGNCSTQASYTLPVLCQPLVIQPSSLPVASVGFSYAQTLSTQRGQAPIAWRVSSGALPAGLNLTPAGVITGTPTSLGSASFTVEAADATACVESRSYTINVNCPTIVIDPATLPDGYINASYSRTLSASGGSAPYTWSVVSGTLPSWLTLNASTGELSGVGPATPHATMTFTVQVAGQFGCVATQTYSVALRALSIGNLVWHDANHNGLRDGGEVGIGGARVQLFRPGSDGLVNTEDDEQVGTDKATSIVGAYRFDNLPEGSYFVKVMPSSGFPLSGGGIVSTDNGVDNDNNATQPGGRYAPFFSPIVQLTAQTEPVNDGDTSNDTDLSVDFGLFPGLCIGDLVWHDQNDDGQRQLADPGVHGVSVQVFSTGANQRPGGVDDELLGEAVTDVNGVFKICDLPPGSYYVKLNDLPWWAPLSSSVTSLEDNGINNDDNGLQVCTDPVYSPVITLTALREPADTPGGSNEDLTIDFGINGYPVGAYVASSLDDSLPVFEPETGRYSTMLKDPFGALHNQGNGDPADTPSGVEIGPDGNYFVAAHGSNNIRRITPAGLDLGAFLTNTAGINKIADFTFSLCSLSGLSQSKKSASSGRSSTV